MRVNDVLEQLDELSYPATTDRIVTELGDPELQLPNGSDRLSDVFRRTSVSGSECAEDAKLTVLSGLDDDAIGRKGYTDRDPPVQCEQRPEQRTL